MRRRQFLAGAAAAVGGLSVTTSASAAEYDWRVDGVGTEADAEIHIEFDREFLERYQPYLVTSRETRQRSPILAGYKVTSEAYRFDWACYWMQLTHQDGLPLVSADTHLGDHEPVFLAIDKQDETVDRGIYTGYHHFAAEVRQGDATLQQQRAGFPSHLTLVVIDPWHHYSHAEGPGGTFLELEDWVTLRSTWIDNGFYEKTSAEAIENPESMLTRNSWWDESTLDYHLAQFWHQLGFGGARAADDLKGI